MVLVRHGQTPTTGTVLPGRAPGLHLADKGREQAEAVGRSPRGAAEGRRRLRLAARAHPGDRSADREASGACGCASRRASLEADFGEWTGQELKELFKLPEWQTVQRYPSGFRFPSGESFAEMQTRITGTIDKLVARHRGGVVVAVSHADPIKAAVAQALGTHLDLFQRIVISPCSVTAIAYGPGGPAVLTVNSANGTLGDLKVS